ncbi:unnamed protein product [Rhizopus stolonifer]
MVYLENHVFVHEPGFNISMRSPMLVQLGKAEVRRKTKDLLLGVSTEKQLVAELYLHCSGADWSNWFLGSSTATYSPESYRLSRGITTLTGLYREWTEELGGNYSVEYMNANHPGWYKDDKTYYMRRRKIIAAIKQYADIEGFSVWDAVRRPETLRARNSKSIDFVSKNVDIMFILNE